VVIPHAIKLKILFLIGFDLNMGIRDGVCLRNKSSVAQAFRDFFTFVRCTGSERHV
jgi:hypothetical protein